MTVAFGKHVPGFFIQGISEGILHGLVLVTCFAAFGAFGVGAYTPNYAPRMNWA
jgi:hypothetical protein